MLKRSKKNDYDSITEQLESAIRSVDAIKLENKKERIVYEITRQMEMLPIYRANAQNVPASYFSYMEAGILDDIRRLQKELKDMEELKVEK